MPTYLIPAKICADFVLDDEWVHWTLQLLLFIHRILKWSLSPIKHQDIGYIKILELFSQ